jgi:hypothetical protein
MNKTEPISSVTRAPTSTSVTTSATRQPQTATTYVATAVPTGWHSKGCFVDIPVAASRSLKYHVMTDKTQLTVERCQAACLNAGFNVAGLEFTSQCWCDYRSQDKTVWSTNQADCNMPCSGNPAQMCGGYDRLSVYTLQPIVYNGWLPMPGNGSCYSDDRFSRALSYQVTPTELMTHEYCQNSCAAQNYTLAGAEYANQCYCDTALRNSKGIASNGAAGCNMVCTGNTAQICGGADRLTLFYKKWRAVGCYVDAQANRTMPPHIAIDGYTYLHMTDKSTMTPESCQRHCELNGYKWAGLEYSSHCFCGAKPLYQQLASNQGSCNMACTGDSSLKCGGANRIFLYTRDDNRD